MVLKMIGTVFMAEMNHAWVWLGPAHVPPQGKHTKIVSLDGEPAFLVARGVEREPIVVEDHPKSGGVSTDIDDRIA